MSKSPAQVFHLLIADDEPEIRQGLQDYFELHGYRVTTAADGEAALAAARESDGIHLALLDVMMPRKNGFDVLREMRAQGIDLPALMLTARGSQEDVLQGFGLGVEDYVTKPFNAEVLALRIRAILSRRLPPSEQPMEIHQIGNLEVNFSSHEAFRGEEPVELTTQEYDLLRYMIVNKGRTLTREQILEDVWALPPDLITRTIDRHIASLRKKIEPNPAVPVFIETVYGVGYRLRDRALEPDEELTEFPQPALPHLPGHSI
ncbi:MAG TPA: response regulator transcription factor [Rhodothermales bacterium]|nr:response regulator transcription factor [Rhodothermales bacterium]